MSFQEKPTAAFILSLIGGIIGLVATLYLTLVYASTPWYFGSLFPVLVFWIGSCSLIVIIGAIMMYMHPEDSKKWGIIVLIFSIIGLGSILGLIGGVLAIVWKPSTLQPQFQPSPLYAYPQSMQYPQPAIRICPQCGRVLSLEVKFCPYCGKQLT
jgi:MFS family permease